MPLTLFSMTEPILSHQVSISWGRPTQMAFTRLARVLGGYTPWIRTPPRNPCQAFLRRKLNEFLPTKVVIVIALLGWFYARWWPLRFSIRRSRARPPPSDRLFQWRCLASFLRQTPKVRGGISWCHEARRAIWRYCTNNKSKRHECRVRFRLGVRRWFAISDYQSHKPPNDSPLYVQQHFQFGCSPSFKRSRH